MKHHPLWQLPAYDLLELAPRKKKYAVCIFVINEGERIREQLRKMKNLAEEVDLIVADGGSTDGSLDEPYLSDCSVRALLTKRGPGKLSAQMRMALAFGLREAYEGLIVIDGNNKDDTSAVPLFVDKLKAGYDHVQGSRYIRGGKGINTPGLRHWGVLLLHAPLISLAAGFRYTDTTNGFRAYSSRFLHNDRVAPFRDIFQKYELHYYLAIRAARLGYRCCEVPVTRSYPKDGPIPSKIGGLRGNIGILITLAKACLGRFNP